MKKKLFGITLALMLLIASVGVVNAANPTVKLWIHGKYVESDVDPFIENGRTLVPVRVISESLGYKVDWVEDTREVIITSGDKIMYLNIDNPDATIDGKGVTLDVAPKLVNARTFVPIRFIAEEFNQIVDWDPITWTVYIGVESNPITDLYAALALLRSNPVVHAKEYDGADYFIPQFEEAIEYVMDTPMYRFDYIEDHIDHIVTAERYAVDMETERVYIYNIAQDRWIEL